MAKQNKSKPKPKTKYELTVEKVDSFVKKTKLTKAQISNSDKCKRYRLDKAKLYRQRESLIKTMQSGVLSSSKLKSKERELLRLNTKIDKYSSKMFKCGKKYAKLGIQRKAILNKINRLKRKLKSMPYAGGKRSEKNAIISEITELNERAYQISKVMGMDIVEKEKAIVGVDIDLELAEVTELVVIWRAREIIEGLLKGGDFEVIIINGEIYSTGNAFSALEELDDFIAEIASKQRDSRFKTPVLVIKTNNLEETIEVYPA